MTWADWWKAASIALTGVLGAIGILTDFKDKETKKVTAWGWAALAGILVSACFGLAVQWKDTSDAQVQRDKDAARTLQLTTQTATSLKNVERLLAPIDRPTIQIRFRVPCGQPKFVAFCGLAQVHPDQSAEAWKKWPGHPDLIMLPRLLFYKNAESVLHDRPSLIYQIRAHKLRKLGLDLDPFSQPGELLLSVQTSELAILSNDGAFKSFLDFPGHIVEMSIPIGDLKEFPVDSVTFVASSGERILIAGAKMTVEHSPLATVYTYEFPR